MIDTFSDHISVHDIESGECLLCQKFKVPPVVVHGAINNLRVTAINSSDAAKVAGTIVILEDRLAGLLIQEMEKLGGHRDFWENCIKVFLDFCKKVLKQTSFTHMCVRVAKL